MILSDYFLSTPDLQWQIARQLGVSHAVVRLPETADFDMTDPVHIRTVADRFKSEGFRPIVVEPMPNSVHDHIKRGDAQRDESIEKVLKMIPLLAENGFETICTNFVAEVGWYRTTSTLPERGGAMVTGFRMQDVNVDLNLSITEEQVWQNLEYFLKAVIPTCEANGIRIALHPDDPPVKKLGNLSRILISKANIQKALDLVPSDCLGVTMCQANYVAMGEDVYDCIRHFGRQGKIFFAHFRDIRGTLEDFHETFHDNGQTDMVKALACYRDSGVDCPVRIDHVPTMAGEGNDRPGYELMGRLYAIGYLRGLAEAIGCPLR